MLNVNFIFYISIYFLYFLYFLYFYILINTLQFSIIINILIYQYKFII